ncbi:hypothetical protein D0Z07_9289 [Hyphodiscus hymeniophilus]|uniref:MARVEL domain-containing protein n=1 Tax=Hyphodiscus hymeniophilus TaxID=353542 RepID=A0A9P6SJQ7_9HELO|nr:hypothetical protein D0Z07_9289 [Hyphodiscus hymeniophilus]
MILTDLVSLCLRIGELAFSATVAGLTGQWLHQHKSTSAWSEKRFIYTEVVAALGILFSLIFLFPFANSFLHWPADLILFILYIVAFGLLVNYVGPMNCGSVWNWHGITGKSECAKSKADVAFAFLAAIFFLASALIGLWVVHRRRATATTANSRRRWYRSARV